MKLQGKIKAIPVKKVTEGMQVLQPWVDEVLNRPTTVWKVISKERGIIKIKRAENYIESITEESIHKLKTLVVEYTINGDEQWSEEGGAFIPTITKQLPLKYKQWQSAIDNGEVDSDESVEFEYIEMGLYDQVSYAKIIPTKKKMYSEDEVAELLYQYDKDKRGIQASHAWQAANWLKGRNK